jgi:hypothetical protein
MLASVKQRLDQILDSSNDEDGSSTASSNDNVSPIPKDKIETTAKEYDVSVSRLTKRLNQVQTVAESGLAPPNQENNPISRLIRASGDKRSLEREIHVDDELLVAVAVAERWQELVDTLDTTSFTDSHAVDDPVSDAEQQAMKAAHAAKTRELGYAAQAELLNPLVVKTGDITVDGKSEGSKTPSETFETPETGEEEQVAPLDEKPSDRRETNPNRDDEMVERGGEKPSGNDSTPDIENDGEFDFSDQPQTDGNPDGPTADPAATNGTEDTATATQDNREADIDEDTEDSLESVLSEAAAPENESSDEDIDEDGPDEPDKTNSDQHDPEMSWLLDSEADDSSAEDGS